MRNTRTLAQYIFRFLVRPIFPFLQWLGKTTGLAKEAKTVEGPHRRQPYYIGLLQPGVSIDEFLARLKSVGFHHEPLAYKDPGQLFSLRRLDDERPDKQYHLRVFSDRELRGHYEYTPEDHPFAHLQETLFEPRGEAFKEWIGPFLDQSPEIS